MRVRFSTEARADRRAAEAYYADVSPRIRVAFRRDLDAALKFISAYPLGAPIRAGETHAKTLAHFPYVILYRVVGEHVFVVAIAHQARDPESYADRM